MPFSTCIIQFCPVIYDGMKFGLLNTEIFLKHLFLKNNLTHIRNKEMRSC